MIVKIIYYLEALILWVTQGGCPIGQAYKFAP
jgi:hypothetical protein